MKKKMVNVSLFLVIFHISVAKNKSVEENFVSAEDRNSEEEFENTINELPPTFKKFLLVYCK